MKHEFNVEGSFSNPYTLVSIYYTYDWAILFRCDILPNRHFVFWEINDDENVEEWLVIEVYDEDLEKLETGKIDVRTLYLKYETNIIAHFFDSNTYHYMSFDEYIVREQAVPPCPPKKWYVHPEDIV